MTKTISTLAALFLATSALTSGAEAGGVRLSFGGPLGSFTAHEKLSDGPAGTARYSRPHCEKPSYASRARAYSVARHQDDDDAPARRAVRKAPKVEVAEKAAPRKPKVYIEKQETKPEVRTAKLEDNTVISDAAPAITVPESPAVQAQFSGTQSTPAPVTPAKTQTASLEQAPATAPAVAPDAEPAKPTTAAVEVPAASEATKAEPVKAEVVKAEAKPEKSGKDAKAKTDSMANRICKRFSAAIAGLVDVPCE